jgi:hypothetical protein
MLLDCVKEWVTKVLLGSKQIILCYNLIYKFSGIKIVVQIPNSNLVTIYNPVTQLEF